MVGSIYRSCLIMIFVAEDNPELCSELETKVREYFDIAIEKKDK